MRTAWVGIVAVALVVTAAAGAAGGSTDGRRTAAAWVAGGTQILFGVFPGPGHSDSLWLMNADGSGERKVADADLNVSVSPTGRLTGWSSLSGDTTGFVSLTTMGGKEIASTSIRSRSLEDIGAPVWAPDERSVVFEVALTQRTLIYVLDLSGRKRLISRRPSRDDEWPAWSPDSRKLAFVSCPRNAEPCEIVVTDRDGRRRRHVTGGLPFADAKTGPVWAPDGHALAFSHAFGPTYGGSTEPLPQRIGIYVVRADGAYRRRVAATPPVETIFGFRPAWSPDSRKLAFSDTRGIWTTDALRGGLRRVSYKGRDTSVDWAPSSRILFTHKGTIYTVEPGERPKPIR